MESSKIKEILENNFEFFVANTLRIQLIISELVSNDFLTFEEADEVVNHKLAISIYVNHFA